MAGKEHNGGDKRGEYADEEGDRHGAPEHRAEQQSDLHVAHPHAIWVREHGREQEDRRTECGDQPLDARMEDCLPDEHVCWRLALRLFNRERLLTAGATAR